MGNLANIGVLGKRDELQEVLRKALLNGYASGNINDNCDGTKFTDYRSGNWYVVDYWEGGEPFGGITRVYYDEVICWSMGYQGQIENVKRRAEVESFLKEALSQPNSAFVVRGPSYYGGGEGEDALRYSCDNCLEGLFDISNFEIEDKIISLNGNVLYHGRFMGGWKNIY